MRFSQLETVRAFGVDELTQLGELDAAHELLVDWALELTEATYFAVHTPEEPVWDDRIRREMPNLRAARRYLLDRGRYREVARLLRGVDEWAQWRDVSEIWAWEAELLDAVDPRDPELREAALAVAVVSSFLRGRRDLAARYVDDLLAVSPTGWPLAQALHMAANVSLFEGRPRDAMELLAAPPRHRGVPGAGSGEHRVGRQCRRIPRRFRVGPRTRRGGAGRRREACGSPTDRAPCGLCDR